jgi:hypothetical protein
MSEQPIEQSEKQKKHKPILLRIGKVILWIVGSVLMLVVLVAILIQLPPVQNFARKKINNYMTSKLETKFEIGHINIGFPKLVELKNVYIEDRQKDTLLSGGALRVDISMFKLISGQVQINDIELVDITAKIKRTLPDTVFNFQFIVDAFTPKNPAAPNPNDTAALQMDINTITLTRINMLYKDDVTGSDMSAHIKSFDTDIDRFQPDKMAFTISYVKLDGLTANIRQYKPLAVPEPEAADLAEAAEPFDLDLKMGEVDLKNVNLDYANDVSAFYTKINIGELIADPKDIDLKKYTVNVDNLALNNTTASIRMGKSPQAEVVAKEVKQEVKGAAQNNWKFIVSEIRLNNNNIQFEDDNAPKLATGMDYAHLDAKALTLHADDFMFSVDSISGKILKGSMTEKSGFVLNKLETDFLYTNNQAYLNDLLIQTPGTTLQHKAAIRYPSIESLASNLGAMQLDVDIQESKVQVKDILVFAPMLKGSPGMTNPNATYYLDGRITGRVNDMNISELNMRGLNDTRLAVRGTIKGLPDANKLQGNLAINEFKTSRRDLNMILPAGTLPTNITLPNNISARGRLNGSMNNANMDLNINTSLGTASINGALSQITNPDALGYDMKVKTNGIDLGTIMQNDSLYGKVTADFAVKGKGTAPEKMKADFTGNIHMAEFNGYVYQNAVLKGDMSNQVVNANINIDDPNIDLNLDAVADLKGEFPAIKMSGSIDSVRTMALNFTTQPLFFRGDINGEFSNTNPDDLEGELLVTNTTLATADQTFSFDTIAVASGMSDTGRFVSVQSDFANLALTGEYKLTQLASVFQEAIQPHFALVPEYQRPKIDPYDFRLNGKVTMAPVFNVFLPDLKKMEDISIKGRFSSTDGWNTNVNAPLLVIGTNSFQGLQFTAGSGSNGIELKTLLNKFSTGAMNLYTTSIDGTIANNQVDFMVDINDIDQKDKYKFGGVFSQPEYGNYTLTLDPEVMLLNYEKWTVSPDNLVKLYNGDVNIRNLVLSKNEQSLAINSSSPDANSPLNIQFGNFRISTLTAFIKQDTLIADGRINGGVVIKDIATQPNFNSDLLIKDLQFQKDTVGDLALKVSNRSAEVFVADIDLTGRGNDLSIDGTYTLKPANQSIMDLQLTIREIQMKTVEAASMGAIKDAKGFLNGQVDLNGTFEKPDINGNIKFNDTRFNLAMLNSYYSITDDEIKVDNEGIRFDSFAIRDSVNNPLTIDGYAYTTNFMNYRFDLDIDADNFKALNTTKAKNQLFYGTLNFDSDLHVGGTEVSPSVDGSIRINENTDFTFVLPQPEPGVIDREGIVRFVDMDSIVVDTLIANAALDSLNKSEFTGMDIAVNIEISKEAALSMVIDEGNGDFIRMKGEALLSAGIDPSGNVSLTGSYELEEGAYELSFNFLKRRFEIEKGSRITWLGEPTKAEVNLTAVYVSNTAPLSLVENQIPSASTGDINRYKQRLPFEVNLMMKGELMKPVITFDIILPEDKNYNVANEIVENVDLRLQQLRTEPSELNKQVFALLLLNRFVSENPFENKASDGFNAGAMARQSVSKILTQQLNNLASDLIQGVDINFDVVSTDDYTTGERQNRSDLNVSLSKELLNDRLKVTVGNNFELEGPQQSNQKSNNIAGDIALDYMLSRDGRYMIRGYRKNEFEGRIDGYIIETGLKFIITLDYNHFRELFKKKEKTTESK